MSLLFLQCPQLHPVTTLAFQLMAHAVGTVESQGTTFCSSVILVMSYRALIKSPALRSTTVSSGNLNHPPAQVTTLCTTQIKKKTVSSRMLWLFPVKLIFGGKKIGFLLPLNNNYTSKSFIRDLIRWYHK